MLKIILKTTKICQHLPKFANICQQIQQICQHFAYTIFQQMPILRDFAQNLLAFLTYLYIYTKGNINENFI